MKHFYILILLVGTSLSQDEGNRACNTYPEHISGYNGETNDSCGGGQACVACCGGEDIVNFAVCENDCPIICGEFGGTCLDAGEFCEGQDTVTDIDGNVYETVLLGGQLWIAENLKVTHYNNGDEIPNITNDGDWGSLYTGAYGDYDNNPANSEIYGRLYNWYAVDDDRGLCMDGWHIPSDDEFKELEMYLGMSEEDANSEYWRGTDEGSKLAGNSDLWNDSGLENNPEFGTSGFTGLPAGYRDNLDGIYRNKNDRGYFWVSSDESSWLIWTRSLWYSLSLVRREQDYKQNGFSIRCLADEITTGCTDPEACNYDETANAYDGSCLYNDCDGDCGGSATYDSCGICSGGNTNHVANSDIDCSGQCFGDAVIDECGVCGGDGTSCCEDGETNNDNPCNPWECYDGQWVEMIIDCAEQMGVPCEGGYYVPPDEGECCSECVPFDCEEEYDEGYTAGLEEGILLGGQSGDANGDGVLNILDIVYFVDAILNP